MRTKKLILTALLAAVALYVQGCMLVAVGAAAGGTVAYVKGDLEATESRDLDTVYAASKKAVADLQYSITKDSKDALQAVIVARDAADKKTTIKLTKVTDNSTKISIRVGTFGDKTKSNLIYQKIHDAL
ncbi:MAG: DUF3568 family protein [Planctomycetota bacterium]|jgi:hypothetical protein